jgi:hypothetical protein
VGVVMVLGHYVLHPVFEWIASVGDKVFAAMALLVVLATTAATGIAR